MSAIQTWLRNGLFACSVKRLISQMLFHPLEESLDRPAAAVHFADFVSLSDQTDWSRMSGYSFGICRLNHPQRMLHPFLWGPMRTISSMITLLPPGVSKICRRLNNAHCFSERVTKKMPSFTVIVKCP